ncbi:MAG TPA: cellulase family glycosylhydrolase, partial [Rugosimonospora sp.]|nr:cellulase family glycosylhydrolase [Rugosimonospora sp.]
ELCGRDALQARAIAGLANFAAWLRRNRAAGFIGEVGWPSGPDSAAWNALADTWYDAADQLGLPVTAWAAGSWPAAYPLTIYRSDPAVPGPLTTEPQAAVVQRHPSTGRYLRGVTLAAGSFAAGDTNVAFGAGNPGRYGLDYRYEAGPVYQDLAARGLRLIRLAVTWERLQPVPFGPLAGAELARVRAALGEARRAGLAVLVDLHGYGYFTSGRGQRRRLGSTQLPTTALADFWRRMAVALAHAPGVAGFGLLNEPTLLAASGRAGARLWERASQQAVTAIRGTGSRAVLTVSGYMPMNPLAWGGMDPTAWIHDPLHRVAYESHAYFDTDSTGYYRDSYAVELRRARVSAPPRCQWLPPLPGGVLRD